MAGRTVRHKAEHSNPTLTASRPTRADVSLLTVLAVLALTTPALTTAAAAEPAPPADAKAAARALETKRTELDAAQSKAKSLQSDLSGLDAEQEKLNAQLLETAALTQKSEGQLSSIEGRLGELEAQEKLVRGSLLQQHGQISALLAALQRMGRNPPPVLATERNDALKMVRSAMLLSSAFPDLKDKAVALSGRLEDLVRVMTDIRQEGERLRTETARLTDARAKLSGLMEVKKLALADRRQELNAVRTASAEIARNVSNLSELIGKLDKTVAEKTGLGSYEAELKKSAPPAPETTAAITDQAPAEPAAPEPLVVEAEKETQVAALAPPPRLKPQIIEIAPSNSAFSTASPGRIAPAIPFATARTKLPLPAQGRRVLAFGERTQFGANSKGIVIETRNGGQVTSPCDGWVAYAGEFRSYGQLLIINAGDGYHVLLAGMSQIDAQPGQFILAGEPVGTMSGGTRVAQSATQMNSPVLYIEFRKDGRPIDPDPWWVAGQQKVQG